MGMFSTPKPRGFHHEFIYVDERREAIERIREDALRQQQPSSGEGEEAHPMHGMFRDSLRSRDSLRLIAVLPLIAGGMVCLFLLLLFFAFLL